MLESQSPPKRRKKKKKKTGKKRCAFVSFGFRDSIRDEDQKSLNSVSFSPFTKNRDIFAAAGGNQVTVYEAMPKEKVLSKSKRKKKILDPWIKVLRCYQDPDDGEVYNTVAWSVSGPPERDHLLLVAGKNGVVRIINCGKDHQKGGYLIGHGESFFFNEI